MTSELQKRVLVVDGDGDIRNLLGVALRARGLLVDEAGDGVQAIRLLRENHYSVLLLDLLMPGMDGFKVLEQLDGPDVPAPAVVLVVTGTERSELPPLSAQKIHGIVKKPFDAPELADLVFACAELRSRNFGAMAIATMIAGTPLLAFLNRLAH